MLPRNKLSKLKSNKIKKDELTHEEAKKTTILMSTYGIIDLFSHELVDHVDRFNEIKDLLVNDIQKYLNGDSFCKIVRQIPIEQNKKIYRFSIDVVDYDYYFDKNILPKDDDGNVNDQMLAHFLKQIADIMMATFLTYRDYAVRFNKIGELRNIKKDDNTFLFPQVVNTSAINGESQVLNTFDTLLLRPDIGGLYLYNGAKKKLDVVVDTIDMD